VYEDGNPSARQYDVGSPWQITAVKPEPEAGSKQGSPNKNLRLGILASYA
jgi:hypothetical protein